MTADQIGAEWLSDPGRLSVGSPGEFQAATPMQGYGYHNTPYDPSLTHHHWYPAPHYGAGALPGTGQEQANLDADAGRSRQRYPAQRTAEPRDIMSNRVQVIQYACPDPLDRRYMGPNGAIQQTDLPFGYWALETPRYNLNQVSEADIVAAARANVQKALGR